MVRSAKALAVDGVRFVTVAMGEDAGEVRAYLARAPFDLPKLPDPTSRVSEAWRVQGLPTSYVVDPRGRLVLQVVGVQCFQRFDDFAMQRIALVLGRARIGNVVGKGMFEHQQAGVVVAGPHQQFRVFQTLQRRFQLVLG